MFLETSKKATIFYLSLSTHVPLSAYDLSPLTANVLCIRWRFIRWRLIRWCLAVEALSVEALIRWWMLSVEGFRDIRWSLFFIRWCLQFISWHHFTYTKLQGMKYLHLAFLFAYPLIFNMTNNLLQLQRTIAWIQRLKCVTKPNLFLSTSTPSMDSQSGLIRWGY